MFTVTLLRVYSPYRVFCVKRAFPSMCAFTTSLTFLRTHLQFCGLYFWKVARYSAFSFFTFLDHIPFLSCCQGFNKLCWWWPHEKRMPLHIQRITCSEPLSKNDRQNYCMPINTVKRYMSNTCIALVNVLQHVFWHSWKGVVYTFQTICHTDFRSNDRRGRAFMEIKWSYTYCILKMRAYTRSWIEPFSGWFLNDTPRRVRPRKSR